MRLAVESWKCFYAFMRTTIDLPDPLYKQVKALAAVRGLKLKQLITNALAELVRRDTDSSEDIDVPEVTGADLQEMGDPEAIRAAFPRGYRLVGPLIPRPAGEVLPDVTSTALETMMAEEDLERHECTG